MLRLTLILLLLLYSFAQCEKANIDEFTSDQLLKLQDKIDSVPVDSAIQYLKFANKRIKNNSIISDSLKAENEYLLGILFRKNGNLDSAAIYLHNATEYIRDSIYYGREIQFFYDAWSVYLAQEKYGDCFAMSRKFKALLKPEKDLREMIWYHFFQESTYLSVPDYPKALEHNISRINLLRNLKDSTALFQALNYQAQIRFYYLNDTKGTFRILDSLKRSETKLSEDSKRQLYGDYGVYLYLTGNYLKSYIHYIKAIEFTKKTEETADKKSLLATGYANLAEVSIDLKKYDMAAAYLDSIQSLGLENIDDRLKKSTLKYQLRLASLTNKDITLVQNYLDTLYNFQKNQYILKYNKELVELTKANKKEKVLLAQKQGAELRNLQSKINLLLVTLGSLLLGLIGFLFYRQRKFRFEKQNLLMQQRLLRSQMNPHFTFNTLYAIQNTIKKDQKGAINYLFKFSRLLRLILENSMQNYVQLEKEIETLRKYMELQLVRFPTKFKYDIHLKDITVDDPIFIPPMLLQPFIENCIEHGFAGINSIGKIEVTLSLQDKFIHCTIEDNGKGFTQNNDSSRLPSSTKLISIFLEKVTGKKLEIIQKSDDGTTGTIVKFLIPFKITEDD